MIPHPVMMGFVNGLAIVIFTSQLGMFKSQGVWLEGAPLLTMLGLVSLTMAIMFLYLKSLKRYQQHLLQFWLFLLLLFSVT